MTAHPTHAALPLTFVAGSLVLTVAACGGSAATTPGPSSGGRPAVTVTATTPATGPATPATSTTVEPSGTPAPGGACGYSALRVRYADDVGGGGAGSVSGTLTFTNTSTTSCTLRGFPGVSYVTGTKGDQVGQAATRTDDVVKTRTLKAGGSVEAALRRTQPGGYGDSCQQTAVAGFRVYPPDSTGAVFVSFPTTGCKSADAPLLQVGPVR